MTKLALYGAILAIALVVWLVQQVQAHGRSLNPASFRPVVGPIERVIRADIRNGPQVLAGAAHHVAGASVAAVVGDVLFLNTRPNVARLDDGMGLFIRITSTYAADGWHLRFEAQPKASLSDNGSATRGLEAVERQIRQALGRMGYRADDGLSAPPAPQATFSAPAAPAPLPTSPPAIPLGPPARLATAAAVRRVVVESRGFTTPLTVATTVAFGRDPVSVDGGAVLALADPLASKTHAVLYNRVDGVVVADLASTNGTELLRQGQLTRVPPNTFVSVVDGDAVVIGQHHLTIRIGAPL